MKFINFSKHKQASFLRFIKRRTDQTWKQLASLLKVNRSMIYFYANEHSKLPHHQYLRLCQIAKIKPNDSIRLIDIKNKKIRVKIPRLSSKLAEFIGALAGDGHMNSITYEVSISMDKDLDKDYSGHILELYNKLFNLQAKKYIQERYNKVKCYVFSKSLVEFLSSEYIIPVGKKKGKLHMPPQIRKDKNLLKAYVKGLFDTDGTFHRHHKKDAAIGIISRDVAFIKEVKEALNKLDFSVSLSNKNLYIYKKEEIDRFFSEIEPANPKHLQKYLHYKKYGIVPLTKELLRR